MNDFSEFFSTNAYRGFRVLVSLGIWTTNYADRRLGEPASYGCAAKSKRFSPNDSEPDGPLRGGGEAIFWVGGLVLSLALGHGPWSFLFFGW